ncbi:MAG TPA: DUF4233 domain-containing protein [Micromonosporaceae bacterium]|jgi:hypothetical protein|nr:DUF4233 domain-containing protein [Micromonosporaceae bacterium]
MTEGGGGEPRSGLRNPRAAVRGLGAGTLIIEAVVLLLGIQPIRVLGGELTGAAIVAILLLAAAAVVLAGLLRRSWAWYAAAALQAALLLAGFLHWSLAVIGVVFALAWAYVLHARRGILG